MRLAHPRETWRGRLRLLVERAGWRIAIAAEVRVDRSYAAGPALPPSVRVLPRDGCAEPRSARRTLGPALLNGIRRGFLGGRG